MAAEPEVTVVVVSWNTRELLDRCLRSLAGQATDVRVIDNASSDGSADMVAREHPWVDLVRSPVNLGFGAAVNALAAGRHTPWLAIANADVELDPGALATLLQAGRSDPQAALLAPQLRSPDGRPQHSVHPFPTVGFTAAFNLGLPHLSRRLADRWCLEGRWDAARPRRVPWALGAFLLVRRAAFDAVGGFDSQQWMYAEDLDLGWRLSQAGWHTRYCPAAVVRHAGSAAAALAWRGEEERRARRQAATYAWMLRRRGAPRTRLVAALNVAGALARAAGAAGATAVLGGPERHWTRTRALADARLHLTGLAPRRRLLEHR